MAGLVLYHVWAVRELNTSTRESSRFPLFAARDHLVMLVASGTMRESDPSWRRLYESVNYLLGMEQKLHAVDVIMRYVRYLSIIEEDPGIRERLEAERREEELAAARSPEFAAVRVEVDAALQHIVVRRTTTLHRAAMTLMKVTAAVVRVAFTLGVDRAKVVVRELGHPSADHIAGWRRLECV
jgi:hypothetical protein